MGIGLLNKLSGVDSAAAPRLSVWFDRQPHPVVFDWFEYLRVARPLQPASVRPTKRRAGVTVFETSRSLWPARQVQALSAYGVGWF